MVIFHLPPFTDNGETSIVYSKEVTLKGKADFRRLNDALRVSNTLTYTSWLSYFKNGEGQGKGVMRGLSVLLAVVAHSLNRLKDDIIAYVLPLAIHLVEGKMLPLGTSYLESLYTWLDECADNILCPVGLYDVVTYATYFPLGEV